MKHHITKKFILFIHALVLTASLAFSQKAELSKEYARFFWKITGTDKNGLPSYVFLQGTIHVGTEDLYPLDSKVMEAFTNGLLDRSHAVTLHSSNILARGITFANFESNRVLSAKYVF